MMADGGSPASREGRHPVLSLFGVDLEVSNPRLAELLTMDAKDALTTDVRELVESPDVAMVRAEAGEAVPDVVLAPAVGRDGEEARRRREFRRTVSDAGRTLGFEVRSDGTWRSSGGVTILTRSIEHPVSFAAATHYVAEIAARRAAIAGEDSTALFVVDGQQTTDVFKVAVRQRRLHDVMRTISLDNLQEVRALFEAGRLDHHQAVALLVPIANIDVGELLSILHSGASAEEFVAEE